MRSVLAALGAAAALLAAAPAAAGPAASPAHESFEIGTSTDALTNGYAPWSEDYALAIEHPAGTAPTLYERVGRAERYGQTDWTYLAGVYAGLGPRTLLNLEAALSPTHAVAPSFAGSAALEERFGGGYGVTLRVGRRAYGSAQTSLQSLGVDRYAGAYRFAYAASAAQLSGTPGSAITQTLSVTRYGPAGDIGIAVSGGRDVESGGAGVAVMRVNGVSVSGHLPVAPGLALAYGVERFTQGGRYVATGIRIGVRRGF